MKRVSWLSFLVVFVVGTDTFLVAPLLPTLTRTYGNDPAVSGWMVSAYALGYAAFALIAGPLSDRLDRKRVLVGGLTAFSFLTAACALAPSFEWMLILRFATGVAASFATPQIWASIPVLVPPNRILKTMGYATAGLSIAQMAGVPAGSFLAAGSWRTPFLVVGTISAMVTVGVAFLFPRVPPSSTRGLGLLGGYRTLFGTPKAVHMFSAYFLFQLGNFTAMAFLGSWFAAEFGFDVTAIGAAMIAIGAGTTIGSLFGSRVVDRLGQPRSFAVAIAVLIALYVALPFSADAGTAIVISSAIYLVGGVLFPILMASMQALSTTQRGTISSVSNALMYAGTTVGGVIGGPLLTRTTGFFGIATLVVGLYAVVLAIHRHGGILKRETADALV